MIKAEAVGVRVRGRWILRDATVSCEAGRLAAICGPNGAGKSTLLNILTGQRPPTMGRALIGGRETAAMTAQALAQTRAVLPQSVVVPFSFTVQTIVELGRLPFKDGATSAGQEIVHAALEDVGATHLVGRQYNTLSGGEQQRVQLARVLAQAWPTKDRGPGALFLDEPTASLDPKYQHQTLAVARRWADRGEAVVVVVHDLNLAAHYADDVVLVRDGIVCAAGPTEEVFTAHQLTDVFGVDVAQVHSAALGRSVFVTCPTVTH